FGALAEACLRLQDTPAAARAALEMHRTLSEESYNAACLLARCTAAVAKNAGLPDGERKALAETYGSQAVELLREAVQKGLTNRSEIEQNKELRMLRDRPDYRRLVTDMGSKQENSSK